MLYLQDKQTFAIALCAYSIVSAGFNLLAQYGLSSRRRLLLIPYMIFLCLLMILVITVVVFFSVTPVIYLTFIPCTVSLLMVRAQEL